jgi:2'-5' RNA ligase
VLAVLLVLEVLEEIHGRIRASASSTLSTSSAASTYSSPVDGIFIISELTGTAREIVRAAQERIDRRLASTSVPHITITGSSGVGPIPLGVPREEMEEALAPITRTTPPITARLGAPMRFMQTDIIVLPLDPHGPLRELHDRIATSGLPFQPARFPFTPHATLSFYVTLDAMQRRELLSVRVDEPVVIDRLQCYRTVDPLPARKVLELTLTGP